MVRFGEGLGEQCPEEEAFELPADVHARLLAHVRRAGRPRAAHDLIIAATAAATGRSVMTLDGKAGFGDLPGVRTTPAP
jgi:tRNA(fMet)-specific endonuclease VapC